MREECPSFTPLGGPGKEKVEEYVKDETVKRPKERRDQQAMAEERVRTLLETQQF